MDADQRCPIMPLATSHRPLIHFSKKTDAHSKGERFVHCSASEFFGCGFGAESSYKVRVWVVHCASIIKC